MCLGTNEVACGKLHFGHPERSRTFAPRFRLTTLVAASQFDCACAPLRMTGRKSARLSRAGSQNAADYFAERGCFCGGILCKKCDFLQNCFTARKRHDFCTFGVMISGAKTGVKSAKTGIFRGNFHRNRNAYCTSTKSSKSASKSHKNALFDPFLGHFRGI